MVKALIVCNARDGSTSLRDFLTNAYRENGVSPSIGYVNDTYTLWPAIIDYIRTGASAALYDIFNGWGNTIEVTHGLPFVLPVVRVAFGPDVKIVRVARDRDSHVASLAKRIKINPEHWLGYTPEPLSSSGGVERPTAIDYGEMDHADWWRLSVEERFGWFCDKQAALTRAHMGMFDNALVLETEELSKPDVLRRLCLFLDTALSRMPPPVHVHKTDRFSLANDSSSAATRLEQVFEQLDYERALHEDGYAAEFFLQDLIESYRVGKRDVLPVLERMKRQIDGALNASAEST